MTSAVMLAVPMHLERASKHSYDSLRKGTVMIFGSCFAGQLRLGEDRAIGARTNGSEFWKMRKIQVSSHLLRVRPLFADLIFPPGRSAGEPARDLE